MIRNATFAILLLACGFTVYCNKNIRSDVARLKELENINGPSRLPADLADVSFSPVYIGADSNCSAFLLKGNEYDPALKNLAFVIPDIFISENQDGLPVFYLNKNPAATGPQDQFILSFTLYFGRSEDGLGNTRIQAKNRKPSCSYSQIQKYLIEYARAASGKEEKKCSWWQFRCNPVKRSIDLSDLPIKNVNLKLNGEAFDSVKEQYLGSNLSSVLNTTKGYPVSFLMSAAQKSLIQTQLQNQGVNVLLSLDFNASKETFQAKIKINGKSIARSIGAAAKAGGPAGYISRASLSSILSTAKRNGQISIQIQGGDSPADADVNAIVRELISKMDNYLQFGTDPNQLNTNNNNNDSNFGFGNDTSPNNDWTFGNNTGQIITGATPFPNNNPMGVINDPPPDPGEPGLGMVSVAGAMKFFSTQTELESNIGKTSSAKDYYFTTPLTLKARFSDEESFLLNLDNTSDLGVPIPVPIKKGYRVSIVPGRYLYEQYKYTMGKMQKVYLSKEDLEAGTHPVIKQFKILKPPLNPNLIKSDKDIELGEMAYLQTSNGLNQSAKKYFGYIQTVATEKIQYNWDIQKMFEMAGGTEDALLDKLPIAASFGTGRYFSLKDLVSLSKTEAVISQRINNVEFNKLWEYTFTANTDIGKMYLKNSDNQVVTPYPIPSRRYFVETRAPGARPVLSQKGENKQLFPTLRTSVYVKVQVFDANGKNVLSDAQEQGLGNLIGEPVMLTSPQDLKTKPKN